MSGYHSNITRSALIDNICSAIIKIQKGPSIKYITLEGGEGVREGVTVCDRGVKSM